MVSTLVQGATEAQLSNRAKKRAQKAAAAAAAAAGTPTSTNTVETENVVAAVESLAKPESAQLDILGKKIRAMQKKKVESTALDEPVLTGSNVSRNSWSRRKAQTQTSSMQTSSPS